LAVLSAVVACRPTAPREGPAGSLGGTARPLGSEANHAEGGSPSTATAASGGALPSSSSAPPEDHADGPRQRIYLLPLGSQLPDQEVSWAERALSAFYVFEVTKLPPIDLPDSAFNRARTRYRAERLLDLLTEQAPKDAFRVLGLTGVDISTTKGKFEDWGILGLATIDGRACVISTFRTRRATKTAEAALAD